MPPAKRRVNGKKNIDVKRARAAAADGLNITPTAMDVDATTMDDDAPFEALLEPATDLTEPATELSDQRTWRPAAGQMPNRCM